MSELDRLREVAGAARAAFLAGAVGCVPDGDPLVARLRELVDDLYSDAGRGGNHELSPEGREYELDRATRMAARNTGVQR